MPRLPILGLIATAFCLSPAWLRAASIQEQNYIRAVFLETLDRQPDSGELTFYSSQFDSSVLDNYGIALSVLNSTAYRTRLITSFYQTYLLRAPDTAGLNYFLNLKAVGATDQQVQAIFLGSAEYYLNRAFSTDSGFIYSALYPDVFGHGPSAGAAASALSFLSSNPGSNGRTALTGILLSSSEYSTILVTDYYSRYLSRAPDPAASALATAISGGSVTNEQVQAAILSSPEFFTLAQTVPEPGGYLLIAASLGFLTVVRRRAKVR